MLIQSKLPCVLFNFLKANCQQALDIACRGTCKVSRCVHSILDVNP